MPSFYSLLFSAHYTRAGEYFVKVTIPAIGLSASIQVVVKPYDVQELDSWMEQTAESIISEPDLEARAELTKALTSVPGNISEPYTCRVVNEAKLVAIPTAVNKLEAIGTMGAAKCLISALTNYSGIEREYIRASLVRIENATSDPRVRREVEAATGTPNK